MANISDLSLKDRAFVGAYRWRQIDPVPCATLNKPLSQCRVALITSAGFVPAGELPFDSKVRGGDPSFRVIPANTCPRSLEEHHRSDTFERSGMELDRNVAFPLDRLHEVEESGEIGVCAPRHLSYMGSITAPGRLISRTAPGGAALMVEDEVDVALLVPV